MSEIIPTDDMKWIKPLSSFYATIQKGYQIEIPAAITNPLYINSNDVVEIAYVGTNQKTITVFHTIVNTRNRVGIKKKIAKLVDTHVGDKILIGILSVFHSRSAGLVVVFDTDTTPEWYDGDRV